ncbi:MAG: ATP-binding protein [Polyangiaceae bacterium]
MLARDLLQPLAEQTANRSVAEIASWLAEGVPVAFADADGWRYVRPSDAVSAPRTRQLCDVPSVPLPTVDVAAQLDVEQLATQELLGVTSDSRLIGAIDCRRALMEAAKLTNGDATTLLGVTVRERLVPRLLHDLGNALTVATLSGALGATEDDGLTEAMEHATRLVDNMRRLYVSESTPPGPFEVADVAHRLEPMLRLAAKPARFSMRRAGIGSIFGASWRLERILLNLVLNASEAADDGRVEVEVVTDTDVIRIDVDDDGPGFRERPGQDDDLRGKGLTVVRRQVALLAGEVALSTSPIGGARVTLTFPRSD